MDQAIKNALDRLGIAEAYIEDLNAVLRDPATTPMGAFCMGLVDLGLRQHVLLPGREQLERAAKCKSVAEADRLLRTLLKERREKKERMRAHTP